MSSLEGMGTLRDMKKSNLSEWQPERAEGIAALAGSRKQLSSSTFLKLYDDRNDSRFVRKTPRKETEYLPQSEEVTAFPLSSNGLARSNPCSRGNSWPTKPLPLQPTTSRRTSSSSNSKKWSSKSAPS